MDLNLLTLSRAAGASQPGLPEVYAPATPRRTARGRGLDRLALYFIMEGNAPLPPAQQEQLLQRLAQSYYKTPGSVTAAMRSLAENLNQVLLERNLRGSSSGRQGIGILTILTLREERLVMGMCGPVQAFLIRAGGVEHFYDPQAARRGLGLGRATSIYYAQANLNLNDALVISSQPPVGWTSGSLAGLHGQKQDVLRSQLMGYTGAETSGLLVVARPGTGKINLVASKPGPVESQPAPVIPQTQTVIQPLEEIPPEQAPPAGEALIEQPQITPAPVVERLPQPSPAPSQFAPQTAPQIAQKTVTPAPVRPRRGGPSPVGRKTGRVARTLGSAGGATLSALRTLLRRMLPGEGLFSLPAPLMAVTAIAVPLIVVTIASMVYLQRGRAGQYQYYYKQASLSANLAQSAATPGEQRQAWLQVMSILDQAESYQATNDSKALREQAQRAYDALNITQRLDYQPAIAGGLPSNTQIIRLAATGSDLYILDARDGSVKRAFSAGRGYEPDNNFQCAPGLLGSQGMGAIVDIVSVSDPALGGARLYGLDAAGNILLCQPGAQPLFIKLAAPYTGWAQPSAMVEDSGNLYILDAGKNAIWIYPGSNGEFTEQPAPFFTGDAPNLQTVIDMAIEKGDLYLLHADGHVALCIFSGFTVSITSCTDPLVYVDMRPGQERQPYQPEPAYGQIESTQPPEPSLYFLQAGSYSLGHFSLRLTFQRQLSPLALTGRANILTRPATAFAISPDKRLAFLALGNEVLYAAIP